MLEKWKSKEQNSDGEVHTGETSSSASTSAEVPGGGSAGARHHDDAGSEHHGVFDRGEDGSAAVSGTNDSLLSSKDAEDFNRRWHEIQGTFVDKPREAVAEADSLVGDVTQHLTEVFGSERSKLEEQWSRGEDVSTEDLRVVIQRYREFFTRLLSA